MSEITNFPLIKIIDGDEALAIAERLGAKQGVLIYDCPCGCGKVKVIYIGEPDVRDLLFYCKNLENYAMEEYIEEIEEENNG